MIYVQWPFDLPRLCSSSEWPWTKPGVLFYGTLFPKPNANDGQDGVKAEKGHHPMTFSLPQITESSTLKEDRDKVASQG